MPKAKAILCDEPTPWAIRVCAAQASSAAIETQGGSVVYWILDAIRSVYAIQIVNMGWVRTRPSSTASCRFAGLAEHVMTRRWRSGNCTSASRGVGGGAARAWNDVTRRGRTLLISMPPPSRSAIAARPLARAYCAPVARNDACRRRARPPVPPRHVRPKSA
jgi:hypothetical protein